MLDNRVGRQIGQYQIVRRIGEGGMAEVYEARDVELARTVAMKLLRPDLFTEEARRRFAREARAAAALTHPNIAAIYDAGNADGEHYIVMEHCAGETLWSLIRRRALAVDEAISYALQILDALAEAHDKGIIHRDIKASNVIVDAAGQVKVLDFGIAKRARVSDLTSASGESIGSESLTGADEILGTVNYMSPEQALKEELDERSDIFSFGALFYQMLTRQLPFEGDCKVDVLAAIVGREPRPLSYYRKDLPVELQQFISRCMAKERPARYRRAALARADLAAIDARMPAADSAKWRKFLADPLNLIIIILAIIAFTLVILYLQK